MPAAVVFCCRAAQSALVHFNSLAEARAFAAHMPCHELCECDHLIGWAESGMIATVFLGKSQPRDRAAALRAAGYIPPATKPPVEFWPAPPNLNPPLRRGAPIMTPEELRAAQDAAVASVADRTMSPHPHGLTGRVADAHREAQEAAATGDIDGAIGAEALAAALTDAALTALPYVEICGP